MEVNPMEVFTTSDGVLTLQAGPGVVICTWLFSETPTDFCIDWLHNKMHIRQSEFTKRSGKGGERGETLLSAGAWSHYAVNVWL